MANVLTVANWLLPMLYLAVLMDYGAAFFLQTPRRDKGVGLLVVWVLHVAFLAALASHLGRMVPVNNYEVLSVLAASTAAVYWIVERASGERRTGVFVLLAAFLMQYTASVFLPVTDLRPGAAEAAGHPAGLHIVPSLVAYTALTISAIYALLYLVARRNLKQHRIGLLFDRLPSLDLLGTMNWHAMLVGWVFITLAIISGIAMNSAGPHESMSELSMKVWTKMVAGAMTWMLLAAAAAGKWLGGWPAARVSLVTLIGFLTMVAMFVASIVLS